MKAQIIKQAFDKYYDAPLEVWQAFADLCEETHFKKNQVIKFANTTAQFGYFLLQGSCGLFVWKENGNACIDLFLEHHFFADDLSLHTGKSSPIEIVALENSSVLRISRANIMQLKETPMGKILFLAGEENSKFEKQNQHIESMTKTAEERYLTLLETSPELVKRIHQKHIASYLGITTQSLSRIRKNILK